MKYIFSLILFFIYHFGSTQSPDLFVKTKSTGNSVVIRWIPANPDVWKIAKSKGFIIQRTEIENELQLSSVNWQLSDSLNKKPFSPLDKNDSLWEKLINENNSLVALHNSIYPPRTTVNLSAKEKTNTEDNLYFIGLLICDIYPEGAKAAGLFLEDTLIGTNKKYAYRISVPGTKIRPVTFFADPGRKEIYPVIESLNGKIKNKSAVLSWKTENLSQYYSSYIIERSADNINFLNITNEPYVILRSQFEKDKDETFYTDTTIHTKKIYYYRIKGKDHFGEYGPYSNTISCISFEPLKGFADIDTAYIDTAYAENDSLVMLKWKLTDTTDRKNLKSAGIYWSDKINGKYTLLNSDISKEKIIYHTKPVRTNYYKIYAVDFNNDTVYSYSYFVLINDKVPPAIPGFISGESDRKGVITLKWKPNTETDLMGYRVFRSNFLNEDFTEITQTILMHTEFTDTVSLQTLTEEIYYKLTAVDQNYNNSDYSNTIKISKPDIIAPAQAPITGIKLSKNKIHITWNPSTSDDVKSTEIWRSEKTIGYIKIFSTKDTATQFSDSLIIPDKGYYYKSVIIDDANNFTESQPVYLHYTSNIYPAIDSINISVNREKKNISLIWKYNYPDIDKFILYKCKKGESPRFIESLPGNTFYYQDKELYMGNDYVYYIKAVFSNGKESRLSKATEVQY